MQYKCLVRGFRRAALELSGKAVRFTPRVVYTVYFSWAVYSSRESECTCTAWVDTRVRLERPRDIAAYASALVVRRIGRRASRPLHVHAHVELEVLIHIELYCDTSGPVTLVKLVIPL